MYNGAAYPSQFYSSGSMMYHAGFDASRHYPSPPISPVPVHRPRTNLELCAPHIIEEKVLGTGAYGTVYLARDTQTGAQYAVKALNKYIDGRPVDVRTQQFQQTEMNLHYQASAHPNVVSLLRILDTPLVTYVFLEYCQEGDLFTNITEYQRYANQPQDAKDVFCQILDAVAHCHSLGIYHRDLKPENILVAKGGHQVKLADFGLATQDHVSRDFGCGSTFYMSPGRIFPHQRLSPRASLIIFLLTECHDTSASKPYYACAPNDIWSLGVILVNLTCGRNPWKVASAKKDSTYRAFRANEDFLKEILPLSDELNDILKRIFTKDPMQRIGLAELKERILACSTFSKFDVPVTLPVPQQPSYVQEPAYDVSKFQDLLLQDPVELQQTFQSAPSVCDIVSGYGSPQSGNLNMTTGGSHLSTGSMDSMESDNSDNSSIASEIGSPQEYNNSIAQPQIARSPSFGFNSQDTQSFYTSSLNKGLDTLAHYACNISPNNLGLGRSYFH